MSEQLNSPNQNEILESNEQILREIEVVARTLDMVPARSDLGQYLAEPATKIEKGPDGHSRPVDAGHSNYDQIKIDTETALDDFRQNKVGYVRVLSGMVNGHVDAHKGTGMKNLRWAFEQLGHFNLTGNTGFHTMLNKSGEVIGKLESGEDNVAENERVLAAGAAKIRSGRNAVMFNDYKDQPDTKMYGIRDPQTGELLSNTFMLVWSGTFSDKDGTSSNFSNLANARIVMIPEEKISAAEQHQVPEQVTNDQDADSFDIDKVDWKQLEDGKFKVRRSDGAVDDGGWKIREVLTSRNGQQHFAVISSWDRQHGTIEKTIPVEQLVSWQVSEK